ncbi:MAG: carbamoyltransferase HypF [Deferribacteres bacterium]|nr:carbamoyltransferase HypF [Deferribacteres bacterium]
MVRCRIRITGIVQGVGFRPFIYRLADRFKLSGFVRNSPHGVEIEVEGSEQAVESFLKEIKRSAPPLAEIEDIKQEMLPVKGYTRFEIKESLQQEKRQILIPPDIATCSECLKEMRDPEDRRYMYPFINCTNCGPRFTIIEKLPYDRKNTTMKAFTMCEDCLTEYENPLDRRFHAQPNACPRCGPKVWVQAPEKAEAEEAVNMVAEAIKEGKIAAVKGIGGFHLICDALNEEAVSLLRKRKKRGEKPFAVMFPDIESVRNYCHISPAEEEWLTSFRSPIVLLKSRKKLAPSVSCGLNSTGAFLPYSPLHHILMEKIGKPVVATSANTADEPIIKDNHEALRRLKGIADIFLLHDRPIRRRCDDSVGFVVEGRFVPTRVGRGFSPTIVKVDFRFETPILAVGAHQKNTIAVAAEDSIYVFQHIGDLESPESQLFFEESVEDACRLLGVEPEVAVADKHPLYYSTRFARRRFRDSILLVQHHFAHAASVAAENRLTERFAAFCFDGTGYGDDKTIWGGEVFLCELPFYRRIFHLAPFPLPGGEKAVREGYRTAVSLALKARTNLPETITKAVAPQKLNIVKQMVGKGINAIPSSSMGRLFDAVASLAGIKQTSSFEAQQAMLLEAEAEETDESYHFFVEGKLIHWEPVIREIIEDVKKGKPPSLISSKFHNAVVNLIVECALRLREGEKINRMVLSGGVFQNRYLTGKTVRKLEELGFNVLINQKVPPNDGGISLGQAFAGYLLWRKRCV